MSFFQDVGFIWNGGSFNLKLTFVFVLGLILMAPLLFHFVKWGFKKLDSSPFWKYKIVRNAKRFYYLLCCSKVIMRFEVHKHCSVIKVDSNMSEVEIIDAVYQEL